MELCRNLELEAGIVEAPVEYGPRMVYGDWLIAQGDPRGEWFALSAAVEASPLDVRLRSAATEVFNAHGPLFIGDAVRLRPGSWFGWLGGFLDEARLQPSAGVGDTAAAAIDLFGHPHARFLRTVALGNFDDIDVMVEGLATAQLPLLETVTLIDSHVWSELADIDVLANIPTLRRLGARRVAWSRPLPQLRELHVLLENQLWWRIAALAPGLEDLALDCRNYSPTGAQLGELAGRLPALRRLRLFNHATPDEVLGAFTPPPQHFELIELSHCKLSADAGLRVASWPKHVAFFALRTEVTPGVVAQLSVGGRTVVATTPPIQVDEDLQWDTGGETWWCHRARTEGRTALTHVPDAGRAMFSSAIRRLPAKDYDRDLMDIAVSLPSERWHAWPWAAAACVRSWKYEHALCEAIAREGLMREPHEPNFYAFITYALRKQKLFAEAAAEVPRAAVAIAEPPRTAQETGAQLCLIDCMFTLAQNGDYQGALDFFYKFTLDDPNLQAALAICYAATGQADKARAALVKAGNTAGAADYVLESNRRSVYDHATAAVLLLPPEPDLDGAMAAITRAWDTYPEREWLRSCRTLDAIRTDPRWLVLAGPNPPATIARPAEPLKPAEAGEPAKPEVKVPALTPADLAQLRGVLGRDLDEVEAAVYSNLESIPPAIGAVVRSLATGGQRALALKYFCARIPTVSRRDAIPAFGTILKRAH